MITTKQEYINCGALTVVTCILDKQEDHSIHHKIRDHKTSTNLTSVQTLQRTYSAQTEYHCLYIPTLAFESPSSEITQSPEIQ